MAVFPQARWQVLEGRRYDSRHHWMMMEGNGPLITIGITDYTQDTAGDILYISLPEPGQEIVHGQAMGSLESGKWVGQVYAPVDGVVIAANDRLMEDPGMLNRDPYHSGWIVKVKATRPEAMEDFLSPEAYRAFLERISREI